ncbi:MAG: hypothetical protein F4207_03725 [Gemmatimonadetes bacterium]|nr:hypothetical protein [Gemmatimonadota bacterium]MYA76609.1 hypothetical protein [Gemmatimonadota bacterium]MYG15526.1 hypothetical protein [Gemmatimonadota bacterium]MYH20022.1 hypothetical protein [Gemmatimonadota bacterium]MYK99927.1 hypothetical protein [Gemmatimonadota bacterium]
MHWKTSIILTLFLVPGAVMLGATVPEAAGTGAAAAASPQSEAGSLDLRGAWKPETYRLKSGPVHEVTGLISFTEKDWSVLFFIVTDEGPRRGSGEGGTYMLEGDKLTFRHLYNLSGGHAVDGFEASELSMRVRPTDAEDAPAEPCTITIDEDLLTIFFPSGNQMTFRRSSR